jgi:hypothetical protein
MKYILFLIIALLCLYAANGQGGQTIKIGTMYLATDSMGKQSFYEVWNNDCPPNVYIHDTVNHYYYIHDTLRIHDTVIQAPPVAYTSAITTQTLPTTLGNDFNSGLTTLQGIEFGTKFRSSTPGLIRGVKYYKVSGVLGPHTGELYSSTGTRLASIAFTNETASGWQTAFFATPITINAATTYVACVYSANGYYTGTTSMLTTAITNAPLTLLADGTDGVNGKYSYANVPIYPASNFKSTFYWVDVVYSTK